MHELAIAENIVAVIEARATERGALRVASVRLRVGEASGVVSDSLAFCFEVLASERPLLASARLDVEHTPHRAWCHDCAAEFAVRDFVARCPTCGAWSDQIVSGMELRVLEMEIET